MLALKGIKFTALLALVLLANCVPVDSAPASVPAVPTATSQADLPPSTTDTAVLPAVSPTVTQDPAEEIVAQLVAAKVDAVRAKDIEGYLALINEADPEYYTEQRNWFLIIQDATIADFSIEVREVEAVDDATLVASLEQHYLYGAELADRTISYEERYIRTPAGWKDADLNFESMETAHFLVKYQAEIVEKAAEVSEEAERAYSSVVSGLGMEALEKITIKLYATQELLRQSTDIRITYLFNGWNEPGESIKLYARRDRSAFAPVIAHELTHKVTLGVASSQPSWLAEGLACYFGNRPFWGGNPLELGWYTSKELSKSIAWLESINLQRVTDDETRGLYYAVSSMVVEFIAETYGRDQIRALLYELSQYPPCDRGYDYDLLEQEYERRLQLAAETVLGVGIDAVSQQWIAWIESQG